MCPACDRDALVVVEENVPLTPISRRSFMAVPPTTMYEGDPVVSGCCAEPLLGGPAHARRFLAMRTPGGAKP